MADAPNQWVLSLTPLSVTRPRQEAIFQPRKCSTRRDPNRHHAPPVHLAHRAMTFDAQVNAIAYDDRGKDDAEDGGFATFSMTLNMRHVRATPLLVNAGIRLAIWINNNLISYFAQRPVFQTGTRRAMLRDIANGRVRAVAPQRQPVL
ncbi:hypothetical protein [Salipiger abyssi]|uniref:hypothetical protein n=1 Tax=Salipiger abyssi TaxID=1250539 RepID=UPI004059BB7F